MTTLNKLTDKELYELERITSKLKEAAQFYELVRKEMFKRGFMMNP